MCWFHPIYVFIHCHYYLSFKYLCFNVTQYKLHPIDEKNVQWPSHKILKIDCRCNKSMFISWFWFCVCNEGIYQIALRSSIQLYESIFQITINTYIFSDLQSPIYMGIYCIVVYTHHLDFQWRVQHLSIYTNLEIPYWYT